MIERGYESTTVQHILERAGVSRSTFYAHFRSKEDVLKASLQNLQEGLELSRLQLIQSGEASPGSLAFVLPFLRHIDSHRSIWKAIVGRESGEIVDRQIRLMLAQSMRKDWQQHRLTPIVLEAKVQCAVGALMALIEWWLSTGVGLTPDELSRLYFQAIAKPESIL